jgi:hypothetical protein
MVCRDMAMPLTGDGVMRRAGWLTCSPWLFLGLLYLRPPWESICHPRPAPPTSFWTSGRKRTDMGPKAIGVIITKSDDDPNGVIVAFGDMGRCRAQSRGIIEDYVQ